MRKKEIPKEITVKRSDRRYEIWRNGQFWAYATSHKLAEEIAEDLRKTEHKHNKENTEVTKE